MATNPFEEITKQIAAEVKASLAPEFSVELERRLKAFNLTLDIQAARLTELEKKEKQTTDDATITERRITVERIDPVTQTVTTEDLGHVHSKFDEVLSFLQVRLAPVLVGPTGSTKTFVTTQLAKALGCKNYVKKKLCRATAPHELLGYMTAQGTYVEGAFTKVVKEGGMIVLDELDAANENVMLIAKDLRDTCMMFPYGMQEVHPDCLVIATMNTWGQGATREYVGRLTQDAAVLNEFVSIEWGYDKPLEEYIANKWFAAYGGTDFKTLTRFINIFWRLRAAAEKAKVRVIFGTRNLRNCAQMLTRGYSFQYVLERCVFHGTRPEDIERIKQALDEPITQEDWNDVCIQVTVEQQPQPEKEIVEGSEDGDSQDTTTDAEIEKMRKKLATENTQDGGIDAGDQIPI